MRKTRFMTWFFLSLSLALFCVRGFRPALEAPLAALVPYGWDGEYGAAADANSDDWAREQTPWQVFLLRFGTGHIIERLYTLRRYLTPEELRQTARAAEQKGDTNFVAFAALHLPAPAMCEDVLHFTESATARDPKLAWLVNFTAVRCAEDSRSGRFAKNWQALAEKFEAWDRNNATPHILRAKMIPNGGPGDWEAAAADSSKIQEVLAERLEWQKQMEEAFAQSRYESYILQRYDLERRVLIARGWDHPLVAAYVGFNSVPSMLAVGLYARRLMKSLGADAEAQGRTEDALRQYRVQARFGECLRIQGHTWFEQIIGISLQRGAYDQLAPALRKAGKADEAAAVEYAQKQLLSELDRLRGEPSARTSNRAWSILLANISATATWVFLLLSVACVVYVNAKLLIRRDKRGPLYQAMTILENYAPIMLFTSCLSLALVYAPYAQNFAELMAGSEAPGLGERFLENTFPTPAGVNLRYDLPAQNPYHGFVTSALVIAALLVVMAIIRHRFAAGKK